jgi:hypothetical protein
MIAGRLSWLAFFVLFCAVPPSSQAQDFPISKFEGYRDLRSALLQEGWKPDAGYGLKVNGKPLYRFPEVLCGPKLCNAKWRDGKGKEALITLLRGDGNDDYRVAPQR